MEIQEFVKNRNPLDYLKIFFRRKWLFAAPLFAGLVLGIVAGFLLPPTFQSSAIILVEEQRSVNPLMQGISASTNITQRMRNLKELILGWNSLVELTKKLNLTKNVQTQKQFENLILGLRKNILVLMRGPNIIQIAYLGKEPVETHLIAKTLTDILIKENMRIQTKETDVAINFLREQLQVYKRKIKESEISSMEDLLKKLLIDSTEQHPMVKELRQRIAFVRGELNSAEYRLPETVTPPPVGNPIYDSLKNEIDQAVKKESAASDSLAYASSSDPNDPNVAIYKLQLTDKNEDALARDVKVNEAIYNTLLQKLETAKITQRLEASQEGTRYTIIDPARLPLRPIKPNKFVVIIIGMFVGCCSGAGLVLGKEFMDQSFLDIEDAKTNLELPILGAISRITTQEEIEKENEKQKKIITIAAIAGGALILIAFLVYLFR